MKQSLKTESKFFWTSSAGKELLNRILSDAKECGFDPAKTTLKVKGRKTFQGEVHLSKGIELVIARQKAKALGEWCIEGLFTGASLEQSTHPLIATHHASRFRGCSHILEIGGGAGFDTAALAKVAEKVTSIEIDPELSEMARWNLSLQGINNVEFISCAAENFLPAIEALNINGIFCDPSRRLPGGERTKDPEKWSPKLSYFRNLPSTKVLGVKVSPGVDIDDVYWSKEWIGFDGECKEQILWKSDTKNYSGFSIVDKGCFINEADLPQEEAPILSLDEIPSIGYLIDPHGALSRSGYFSRFLLRCEASLIHPKAYLGYSNQNVNSPAVTVYKLLDSISYHSKNVSKRLQELGLGEKSIIKTRGVTDSPESIRKELSFSKDGREGVLYFVRLGKEIKVFICERA